MGNKNVKKVVSVAVLLLVCGVSLFNSTLRIDPPIKPEIQSILHPQN